jgi:hypothetical protein
LQNEPWNHTISCSQFSLECSGSLSSPFSPLQAESLPNQAAQQQFKKQRGHGSKTQRQGRGARMQYLLPSSLPLWPDLEQARTHGSLCCHYSSSLYEHTAQKANRSVGIIADLVRTFIVFSLGRWSLFQIRNFYLDTEISLLFRW